MQDFTLWQEVSSFDGFFLHEDALRIVKEAMVTGKKDLLLAAIVDMRQEMMALVNAFPDTDTDTDTDTAKGIGSTWLWVKHCVRRWSPLQMRFSKTIFIMKRNE